MLVISLNYVYLFQPPFSDTAFMHLCRCLFIIYHNNNTHLIYLISACVWERRKKKKNKIKRSNNCFHLVRFIFRSLFLSLHLQTVSVTVSVLTLTFISIDRWYAICFPLQYVSTNGRAWCSVGLIWIGGMCTSSKHSIFLSFPKKKKKTKTIPNNTHTLFIALLSGMCTSSNHSIFLSFQKKENQNNSK